MITLVPLFFAVSLVLVVVNIAHSLYKKRDVSFLWLVLLAWLSMFALLSGFSIGWLLSMVNILIALALLIAIKGRPEFAFLLIANSLLALFMRGHWLPARSVLMLLLAAALLYRLRQFWATKRVHTLTQAQIGLQILGLVLFLSFLLSGGPISIMLALLAGTAGLLLGFGQPYYRWHFAAFCPVAFTWLYMLVVPM